MTTRSKKEKISAQPTTPRNQQSCLHATFSRSPFDISGFALVIAFEAAFSPGETARLEQTLVAYGMAAAGGRMIFGLNHTMFHCKLLSYIDITINPTVRDYSILSTKTLISLNQS
jgi:hypothetical protein